MKKISRRRALELISTLPLAGLLGKNILNKSTYNKINPENAYMKNKESTIKQFHELNNNYFSSLENLCDIFHKTYYKSHSEPMPTLDINGNPTIRMKTVWEWEEPKNMLKHQVIYSWKEKQEQLMNLSSFLLSDELIDRNKINEIKVEEAYTNQIGKSILSGLIYGGEIALLLGYEEIIASMRYTEWERISLKEKVKKMNTEKQIGRRNFFKIGAAITGAIVAGKLEGFYNHKKENEHSRLKEELYNLNENQSTLDFNSTAELFNDYFNSSPNQIIGDIKEQVGKMNSTFDKGIKEQDVKKSFIETINSGQTYVNSLEEYFLHGIPPQFKETLKSAFITKSLDKIKSSTSSSMKGVILEGLMVGGTLAAILIPAEIYNSKKK